jgi:hypothetical protein
MLPFDKSKIFSLSLTLSTFAFTLFFGHELLFGEADFHKIKSKETFSRSHVILTQLMTELHPTVSCKEIFF